MTCPGRDYTSDDKATPYSLDTPRLGELRTGWRARRLERFENGCDVRTRRSVEKEVSKAAKRRAKADREAAKLDDMPRPIVDAPAALIVKRAMGRKAVQDAQRQANTLSRLKQGARAPLGVAVAEALRTTKDAADAEFRQSRGRKPRQLGLSTPGLPLTTRDLVKSQAAEIAAQKERERLEAAKRKRMLEMMED